MANIIDVIRVKPKKFSSSLETILECVILDALNNDLKNLDKFCTDIKTNTGFIVIKVKATKLCEYFKRFTKSSKYHSIISNEYKLKQIVELFRTVMNYIYDFAKEIDSLTKAAFTEDEFVIVKKHYFDWFSLSESIKNKIKNIQHFVENIHAKTDIALSDLVHTLTISKIV